MSTFSAYGMGPKGILVDRPLNDYEREHRFDIKKSASDHVLYDLSLTKLNSTFVECVDKWYSMRGFVGMAGGVFSLIIIVGIGLSLYALFSTGFMGYLILPPMGLIVLWLPAKAFFSDAFTYTHYPIRLNRKNRQVYAFRRDGTVLKARWDDLYWTMCGSGSPMSDIFVAGHVMDKNGVTVKETVALSIVSVGKQGEEKLRMFFEFFRRYMEDGPGPALDILKPVPLIMLPGIDHERESWYFGWEYLTGNAKGFLVVQILFQVFFFPISLFRWIVMRTSRIPQWPQWVEDECAIADDDPWERDGRHRA